MARTKTNIEQKITKTRRTQSKTDIQNKHYLCFSDFSIFIFYLWFLKWFLQEMLSYRLGTVNDFHWGFKPVFKTIANLTFIGEENKYIYTIYTPRSWTQMTGKWKRKVHFKNVEKYLGILTLISTRHDNVNYILTQ